MQTDNRIPAKLVLTPEMVDAGVEALSQFEDGDGSSLAERVVEVFLYMIAECPSEKLIRN